MSEEERYQKLANERAAAIDQSNKTYDDLLNKNTEYSQGVRNYLDNYQNTQNDIYDKQTAFQVDLQNQNKERAEREYQKEAQASKNAYYDFINPYGVQAEIQAQNGLRNDGYSETVKSQAWTTQQNRTAQARAKMQDAKLQFDNAIKEAYLNNDTLKAELALKILEQEQQEALRSFNYVSDTQQNRLSNNQNLDSDYNNRYNTLYSQIQEEKARQEAIRQWEKEMAFKEEQARIAQQQWEKEYALSQATANARYGSGGSGGSGGGYGSLSDGGGSSLNDSGKTVNPYTGTRSKDADTFGTFSNGYQPKGINGYGAVSKTGDTYTFETVNPDGTPMTAKQNIWKTPDGTKWYWDGRYNQYIKFNTGSGKGSFGGGSSGGGGFR